MKTEQFNQSGSTQEQTQRVGFAQYNAPSTNSASLPITTLSSLSSTLPGQCHHRRHNSVDASFSQRKPDDLGLFDSLTKLKSLTHSAESIPDEAKFSPIGLRTPQVQPNRTNFDVNFDVYDEQDTAVGTSYNTKDCVDYVPPNVSKSTDELARIQRRCGRWDYYSRQQQQQEQLQQTNVHRSIDTDTHITAGCSDATCLSGLSSAISSPSPSTFSSPLSTPTRFSQHVHHCDKCCDQSTTVAVGATRFTSSLHQHIHHAHHHHTLHQSGSGSGCKKLPKYDSRLNPSPYRQLLPIALCILSFATVFSILIVYMDTTEIRHQQFRLNMSRDYELHDVAQDDPTLIAFLRDYHMRKYRLIHFQKDLDDSALDTANEHLNFSSYYHDELVPKMAHYVADLVGGKMNGTVIQSLPGSLGQLITAPWLAETLNWAGIIVEPEPRRFFTLRRQNVNRPRLQFVHACVSPNPYPKEVTIHNDDTEVRINSLLDEETTWFNSRVKCFPLYALMLACDRVEYELLSLGVDGHELEILQTLPFNKIKIQVISIHLSEDSENVRDYIQAITKFLAGKFYKLQKNFGRNYFYKRTSTINRTRKKDVLLMKTP